MEERANVVLRGERWGVKRWTPLITSFSTKNDAGLPDSHYLLHGPVWASHGRWKSLTSCTMLPPNNNRLSLSPSWTRMHESWKMEESKTSYTCSLPITKTWIKTVFIGNCYSTTTKKTKSLQNAWSLLRIG